MSEQSKVLALCLALTGCRGAYDDDTAGPFCSTLEVHTINEMSVAPIAEVTVWHAATTESPAARQEGGLPPGVDLIWQFEVCGERGERLEVGCWSEDFQGFLRQQEPLSGVIQTDAEPVWFYFPLPDVPDFEP